MLKKIYKNFDIYPESFRISENTSARVIVVHLTLPDEKRGAVNCLTIFLNKKGQKMELKKMKTDEISPLAHHFFIKLYCERKGVRDQKTIQEAKQSWMSLSLPMKKHFYKTSAEGSLLKHAHGLSKAEIYLKEKFQRSCDKSLEILNSTENHKEDLEPHEAVVSINESETAETGSQPSVEGELIYDKSQIDTILEISGETQYNAELNPEANLGSPYPDEAPVNEISETASQDALDICTTNSNQESTAAVALDEPAPPIVKVGKDLYEMIKGSEDKDWKVITKKEKNHYNSAVRTLKREYIKKYTKYLESLSKQQLFDHYMKTLY